MWLGLCGDDCAISDEISGDEILNLATGESLPSIRTTWGGCAIASLSIMRASNPIVEIAATHIKLARMRVRFPCFKIFIVEVASFARGSKRSLGTAIQCVHRTTLVFKTAIVPEIPTEPLAPFLTVESGNL